MEVRGENDKILYLVWDAQFLHTAQVGAILFHTLGKECDEDTMGGFEDNSEAGDIDKVTQENYEPPIRKRVLKFKIDGQ